jgi:hypothetical protein
MQKVVATPEWKEYVTKNALKSTVMVGDRCAPILGKDEQNHRQIMKAAGFMASKGGFAFPYIMSAQDDIHGPGDAPSATVITKRTAEIVVGIVVAAFALLAIVSNYQLGAGWAERWPAGRLFPAAHGRRHPARQYRGDRPGAAQERPLGLPRKGAAASWWPPCCCR